MSSKELLISLIGLAAGWVIVSIALSRRTRKSIETLSGDWFEVLGVAPDAKLDQIDEAYEKKSQILKESEPSIMTIQEHQAFQQKQGQLDIACREGRELRAAKKLV